MKRYPIWQLTLVLFLFMVGCVGRQDSQKVFQVTCWNGGKVIYDETVVRAASWKRYQWETLDGKEASIPWGQVACTNTLLRIHQPKETR